ncbi:MAG: cell division protein FtsL [Pseudomonadota bacterium]
MKKTQGRKARVCAAQSNVASLSSGAIGVCKAKKKGKGKKILVSFEFASILWIVLALLFFISSAFFYSWSRILVTHVGYELGRLKEEEGKLKSEKNKLTIEKSYLTSPDRLENIGLNKMKLIYPESWQIVDMRTEDE